MKKYIFIILFMGLLLSSFYLISKLNQKELFGVAIDKPYTVFIFLDHNECLGCSKIVQDCFNYINFQDNSNVCAVVECNRDIELKQFKNNYKWRFACIKDNSYKIKYNISPETLILIASYDTEEIIEIERNDLAAAEKLSSFMNSSPK